MEMDLTLVNINLQEKKKIIKEKLEEKEINYLKGKIVDNILKNENAKYSLFLKEKASEIVNNIFNTDKTNGDEFKISISEKLKEKNSKGKEEKKEDEKQKSEKVSNKEKEDQKIEEEDEEEEEEDNESNNNEQKDNNNSNNKVDNKDNIRRKIKRGFFNSVTDNLNKVLNTIGSKFYFMKFSRSFSSDVVRKNNKDLLYITLENIFEKKELFKENELDNYYHNLKVVKSEEIQGNEDLKKIMGKTYFELFNEYINSKEFKIDEIRRLRENNMEESYIQKYIFLAQHLLEFFQNL